MGDKVKMNLSDRFEFRNVKLEEAQEVADIESICFPPHEACSKKDMYERVERASELFLVAVDKENGKIAGFLNGLATDEMNFRDEFFTDAKVNEANGKNIFLLGLDVRPEYRMQGLARELMRQYVLREQAKGRKMLKLTCLEQKVEMYKKMGYQDEGISASVWGNEVWHEMRYIL